MGDPHSLKVRNAHSPPAIIQVMAAVKPKAVAYFILSLTFPLRKKKIQKQARTATKNVIFTMKASPANMPEIMQIENIAYFPDGVSNFLKQSVSSAKDQSERVKPMASLDVCVNSFHQSTDVVRRIMQEVRTRKPTRSWMG